MTGVRVYLIYLFHLYPLHALFNAVGFMLFEIFQLLSTLLSAPQSFESKHLPIGTGNVVLAGVETEVASDVKRIKSLRYVYLGEGKMNPTDVLRKSATRLFQMTVDDL